MFQTTTVRLLKPRPWWAGNAAGLMLLAMLFGAAPSTLCSAQTPKRHWLHAGAMPPGAIGSQRLLSRGPSSSLHNVGWVQPVEVSAPAGFEIAARSGGGFTTPRAGSLLAGMRMGPVYRMKATGVIADEPIEVYPTVEVIGRLYPPPGKRMKFPIPVELTDEELKMAAAGAFITRVIYLEDPNQALAIEEPVVNGKREQQWFEARADQDPLLVADRLGRPVAILRIGSRLPGEGRYNDPPIQMFDTTPRSATPIAVERDQLLPAVNGGDTTLTY
ncbi:MAG: hypothetical protein AAGB00_00565 [Planctomycetota bacterium]